MLPLGDVLQVERGARLQDSLFGLGVEFPCGGRGRCKGCKVKVVAGSSAISHEDRQRLTSAELEGGWRLACQLRAETNLSIELAQWETPILAGETPFAFVPREGFGIAIDLGTTTLAAQLLDLRTGRVLAVRTSLNAQARYGADIMSRVEFAVLNQGQPILERVIREQISQLVGELVASISADTPGGKISFGGGSGAGGRRTLAIESIVVVGKTVMHHLFSGISVEPLSQYPFEPQFSGPQTFRADELGWDIPGNPTVYFLPCLGGFVGSDILAGVLATKLHERESLSMLMDLGTNGEIVLGNREQLLCAGTAAGPAFEGARISMGMRAATGAISEVRAENGQLSCHILGDATPRGICGSGLVDAAAASLDLGWILPSGRLAKREALQLAPPVSLNQKDIRELQLAKGAIAAGSQILLEQWRASDADVSQVFLAGAFGNYINQANARRIGLLEFPADKIVAAANTALLGAKLALFSLPHVDIAYPELLKRTRHVSLNEAPGFQEIYAEKMAFP